jgi:hypothetical protein
MKTKTDTLTCGEQVTLSSLTLEQLDAFVDTTDRRLATRQAAVDSLNNAGANWTLASFNQHFDTTDLQEIFGTIEELCGIKTAGEATASA